MEFKKTPLYESMFNNNENITRLPQYPDKSNVLKNYNGTILKPRALEYVDIKFILPNQFESYLKVNNKVVFVGTFQTREKAQMARLLLASKLNIPLRKVSNFKSKLIQRFFLIQKNLESYFTSEELTNINNIKEANND